LSFLSALGVYCLSVAGQCWKPISVLQVFFRRRCAAKCPVSYRGHTHLTTSQSIIFAAKMLKVTSMFVAIVETDLN